MSKPVVPRVLAENEVPAERGLARSVLSTSPFSLDALEKIADMRAYPVLREVLPARKWREAKLLERDEGPGARRSSLARRCVL